MIKKLIHGLKQTDKLDIFAVGNITYLLKKKQKRLCNTVLPTYRFVEVSSELPQTDDLG